VTRIKKNKSKLPTFVAAHQADVRGPPLGRGSQVESQ